MFAEYRVKIGIIFRTDKIRGRVDMSRISHHFNAFIIVLQSFTIL